MPKKTSPKQKNGLDKIINKFTAIFEKKPIFSFTALTILLMVGVFMLEQGAQWFKASILEVPTFDGTVMPVQIIPNWYKTGGSNDILYSDYDSSELITIPEYNASQLKSTKTDADTVNAQITYSVVYMGNYEYDHTENAGSHLAVDIRIPTGTPVYAIANGVVSKAVVQNSGFGYHICIKHTDVPVGDDTETIYSCYAHLSSVLVSEGQTVTKGTKIALSGDTGTATTPHLHFQIDRDSAPWHPWWPFTSTEASNAGLDFFSAINAGLGKSEALENTINPMEWVQDNLNYSGGSSANGTTDDNDDTEEVQELSSLSIESNKSEVESGETITLTITALDEDGDKMNSVDSSDISFTSTDKTITMPSLSFSKGVATAKITTNNTGSITFIVRTGTITDNIKITVTEENIDTDDTDTDDIDDTTETTTDTNAPASYSLSAESFVKLGDTTPITITALDENGDKMTGNFSLSEDLELNIDGVGKLSETSLNGNDFNNGKATITFTGVQTGSVIISLGSEEIEITTVEENMSVSSFKIETPENFTVNQSSEIIIYTLDENGQKTPSTFNGTTEISLVSGQGYFSKDELTRDDFKNGKAEISFTATSNEDVKIKAKSGVLVGFSDDTDTEAGQGFSDVSTTNKYYLAINSLYSDGIINGFSDGTFRPANSVNRAESLKMLLLALEIPIKTGTVNFADVEDSAWYVSYLYTGVKESIVNGFNDGTFRAANNVNRAEFFKILLTSADVELEDAKYAPFDDVSADDWYATYAKYARDNDLLDFADGKFEPAKAMTRAEVAEAVYRFKQL